MCNGDAHTGRLRETIKQHHIRLTGTLLTCSRCVQAEEWRAAVLTATCSRFTQLLQPGFVDLHGPRRIASAGRALYLILIEDDATIMGWI